MENIQYWEREIDDHVRVVCLSLPAVENHAILLRARLKVTYDTDLVET